MSSSSFFVLRASCFVLRSSSIVVLGVVVGLIAAIEAAPASSSSFVASGGGALRAASEDHGSERGGDSEMTGVSSVDGLVPAKRPVGDASRLPDDAVSTTAASQSASSTGLSPSKKRARRGA